MNDLKTWVVFLGAMGLMIGVVLAALYIIVLWMLGITDYYKRRNVLCWALAVIVPPFGIFNGAMFEIKKWLNAECCSNLAFFMVVAEYAKVEIFHRKNKTALEDAD